MTIVEKSASTASGALIHFLHSKFERSTLHLATGKKINWVNLSTLVAVAILVGTEMVGASWAAGWALGGLLQLDPLISRIIEVVFGLSGFVLLYYFMRTAIRHEPIR
jgi:hypothetical protein